MTDNPNLDLVPGRCDTCYKQLEIGETLWTYRTPSTGTEKEAMAGTAFWAEDPYWALCEMCHTLVKQVDAGLLVEDAAIATMGSMTIKNQGILIVGDDDGMILSGMANEAVSILRGFMRNRDDYLEEEVNGGVPRHREDDHG